MQKGQTVSSLHGQEWSVLFLLSSVSSCGGVFHSAACALKLLLIPRPRAGIVKKVAALRIVHDKWAGVRDDAEDRTDFLSEFDTAKEFNSDISQYLPKAQEDINPLRALDIFERVSDEVGLVCA